MTRLALVVLAGLIVAAAVLHVRQVMAVTVPAYEFGQDHRFYVAAAQRWLDTGSFYLPHQLAGPYDVGLMRDVLYPPVALHLFVPFTVLPWVLWWIIPLAIIGYVVWSYRPSRVGWFLIGLAILWPRTMGALTWGNTDLWVSAFVAGGVRWGWPAALLVLKPTFAPLALVAVRDRRLWIGGLILGIASLPLLPLWFDYLAAMRNLAIGPDYSLLSLPIALIPIIARYTASVAQDREQHARGGNEGIVGPPISLGRGEGHELGPRHLTEVP